MTTRSSFRPVREGETLGQRTWRIPLSPYERFMQEEGIPIYRGIGVYDSRELPLGEWKRMGAKGSFIVLDGIERKKGMFVVEVPASGATSPVKHLYDEFYLVIEGRGSTEVWRSDVAQAPSPANKKQVFEWQPGSLFMVPINASFRFVNAASSPALLLAANNSPLIINIFQSHRFVFDNDYEFSERWDGSPEFFKAKDDVEHDPVKGRAMLRSGLYPDIVGTELPLDNQRAPGSRRLQPGYPGYEVDAAMGGFIAEYWSGRYTRCHYHESGAVIVCLRGKGYSFTWPKAIGTRPWEVGMEQYVKRQDYVPGGMVAAAPGGGEWFHQHFSIGKEPLRFINYWGGPTGDTGRDGDEPEEQNNPHLLGLSEGGKIIKYSEEDPMIRKIYQGELDREGVQFRMPEEAYR